MQPVTRAAVAVSAGLLMIGGAGTLSYWTDEGSGSVDGLKTGEISLGDVTCAGDWQLDGADLGAAAQLVPGDVVTRSCTFTVTLKGTNATATLDVTDPSFAAGSNASFVAQLQPSATYTIAGSAVPATLTAADDGSVVTAALEVEFDDLGDPRVLTGADLADPTKNQNLTNTADLAAALEDVTVTLIQS